MWARSCWLERLTSIQNSSAPICAGRSLRLPGGKTTAVEVATIVGVYVGVGVNVGVGVGVLVGVGVGVKVGVGVGVSGLTRTARLTGGDPSVGSRCAETATLRRDEIPPARARIRILTRVIPASQVSEESFFCTSFNVEGGLGEAAGEGALILMIELAFGAFDADVGQPVVGINAHGLPVVFQGSGGGGQCGEHQPGGDLLGIQFGGAAGPLPGAAVIPIAEGLVGKLEGLLVCDVCFTHPGWVLARMRLRCGCSTRSRWRYPGQADRVLW